MLLRYWFPIALVALLLLALPGLVLFAFDLFGREAEVNSYLEGRFGFSHHLPVSLAAASLLFLVPIGIVLLYFLRLKRKPVAVPTTFLWKKSIEDLHVNRLMQWLRRNVLLLLQILAILAILYAVLGPRLHGSATSGKHYILLIDNSASMSATDVQPNRLEWAKAEAQKEIDAATDNDVGLVIAFNSSAEIRQSWTTNRALLRKAVDDIKPTSNPTRIEEALSLAESLPNPTRSTENEAMRPENPEPGKERTYAQVEGIPAEVHLFSDGRFADVPDFSLTNLQMNFHVPGTPGTGSADNIGIVHMNVVRDEDDPTRLQVAVRLLNFRDQPAQATLALDVLARGSTVRDARQRPVYLPRRIIEPPPDGDPNKPGKDVPGEQTVRFDLTGVEENADVVLRAKLAGNTDAFPLDDEAWLVLGIVRKARVLIAGPSNPVLRHFFDSKSTRQVAEVQYIEPELLKDRENYLDPARSGEFDLVIFDRCAPATEEEMPRANTFFIGQPPPPWKTEEASKPDDPYRVEKVLFPQVRGWTDQHPIMHGLRGWHELEIAEGFRVKNLPERTPRLLEGDRDLVLMFALSRQAYSDIVLAFPLETTDAKWNTRWFLKPLFPLFLRNLLYGLGNIRDATAEETVRPGQIKLLRPSSATNEVRVTSPSGQSVKLERGTRADFAFGGTTEVGVYTASWPGETRRFAVNLFDPEESHIEPRPLVQIGAEKVQAGQTRKQPRELWRWLVLAGLIFLLVEWWIYNRRVQV
jgi:von Willebrand factor type A domain/Aerotolerance regulator N-terminal